MVAATSVANLIANINNNNDNNNNNNNQDNINNNNQKSSSADATNQGNARNLQIEGHETFEDMKKNNSLLTPEQSAKRLIEILNKPKGAFKSGDHVDYFDEV